MCIKNTRSCNDNHDDTKYLKKENKIKKRRCKRNVKNVHTSYVNVTNGTMDFFPRI